MLPTLLFFCFLQGIETSAISHLPFLPTPEGITTSDIVSRSLGLPDSNGVRKPRNVVSILSLLWPQVVGPIENGVIKEEGYKEIPKTSLENQLDGIRKRSKDQMAMRARVRDLINDGVATSQLSLNELYALNTDMGGYNPHHMYHPLHQYAATAPYHPEHMPHFDSVVIQDSQFAPFPAFHEIMNNLHQERDPKKHTIHTTTKAPSYISPEEIKRPQNSEQHDDQNKIVTTEIPSKVNENNHKDLHEAYQLIDANQGNRKTTHTQNHVQENIKILNDSD